MKIETFKGNQGQDIAIVLEKIDFFFTNPEDENNTIVSVNGKQMLIHIKYDKFLSLINS